jgi:hypothetical protein
MKKEVCNAYTELNDPAVQRARYSYFESPRKRQYTVFKICFKKISGSLFPLNL